MAIFCFEEACVFRLTKYEHLNWDCKRKLWWDCLAEFLALAWFRSIVALWRSQLDWTRICLRIGQLVWHTMLGSISLNGKFCLLVAFAAKSDPKKAPGVSRYALLIVALCTMRNFGGYLQISWLDRRNEEWGNLDCCAHSFELLFMW